jgi:hypothetical protein
MDTSMVVLLAGFQMIMTCPILLVRGRSRRTHSTQPQRHSRPTPFAVGTRDLSAVWSSRCRPWPAAAGPRSPPGWCRPAVSMSHIARDHELRFSG